MGHKDSIVPHDIVHDILFEILPLIRVFLSCLYCAAVVILASTTAFSICLSRGQIWSPVSFITCKFDLKSNTSLVHVGHVICSISQIHLFLILSFYCQEDRYLLPS